MGATADGFFKTLSKSSEPIFTMEAYYQEPIDIDPQDEYNEVYYGIKPKNPVVIPPLLPMGSFVAELIEAKNEHEIEMLCDKYHLPETKDTPSAKRLLAEARTIAALMQLYSICLPIVRGTAKNNNFVNIFTLLHQATASHQQIFIIKRGIQAEDFSSADWRHCTKNHLYFLPSLPLVEHFDAFQSEHGHILQDRYGHAFKQMRRRKEKSPPRAMYHYWDNPSAYEAMRECLWKYSTNNRPDDAQYILKWDACGLASKYLAALDGYLESIIKDVKIRFNSPSGTAKLIANKMIPALYLWVFTQIQAQAKYNTCQMCGRLFLVGAQKGKKYCGLHEKYEIAYYTKVTRQIREETSQKATEDSLPR